MGQFEIFKRQNGQFQFNLKAGSGEIILTSEGYMTKDSCKKGIESVRRNSSDRSKFELLESRNGKNYFNLRAANGRVVATSKIYDSMPDRDNGVKAVQMTAPKAKVVDLTVRG